MRLKIDLHVHTCYSYDSVISPKELVYYARKCGLDAVAVTDHDRLDGALRIAKETDFLIIPGVEVSSQNGHIVALDVQETIPKGLSAEETVDKIHQAKGTAVACHPKAFFKRSLGNHTYGGFDAVEVINSSALPFGYSVKQAKQLASRLNLPQVAGTDAHYGPEIGCAYTLVNAEPNVDDVIKAISKGLCEAFGNAEPWTLRLEKELVMLKRKMKSASARRSAF